MAAKPLSIVAKGVIIRIHIETLGEYNEVFVLLSNSGAGVREGVN